MANYAITISRQAGSGGREIGRKLADRLGISFYDRDKVTEAAQREAAAEGLLEKFEEKATSSLLYSLVMGTYAPPQKYAVVSGPSLKDKLYGVESNVIKEIMKRESAVFVGRCSDCVLKSYPRCVNIYVYADTDWRIRRVAGIYGLKIDDARAEITKSDRQRGYYYNYYTGSKWGDMKNYHLCVNSGQVGVDGTVNLLSEYVRLIGYLDDK